MAEFESRKGGVTPSPPKKKKEIHVIPSSDGAENGGAINVDETSPSKIEVGVSERRDYLRKETQVKRPEQETSAMLAVWTQRTPPVGMKRKSPSEDPGKSPNESSRKSPSGDPGKSPRKSPRKSPGERRSPNKSPRKSPSGDPGKSPRKSPGERKSGGSVNRGRGRARRRLDF